MRIDRAFLRTARAAFNPYTAGSGTEHVAFQLYSLARTTRPRTVVEYGSGYTTLFLLAALADNAADIEEERAGLRARIASLGDVTAMTLTPDDPRIAEWFTGGDKASGLDPAYYLEPYEPHLYSFEQHDAKHPYARQMMRIVRRLKLERFLTYLTGSTFEVDAVPPEALPIDLAWNDHKDYEGYFEAVWPSLNPSGGLMIFHNTVAADRGWAAIEWMKAKQASAGDLELLTLYEPHKLNQNSCTILRRTSQYRPRHLTKDAASDVLADVVRFSVLGRQ